MTKVLRFLVGLALISGLAWYAWAGKSKTEAPPAFSGWLEGEEYRVVAETAGKVDKLLVKEGEKVKKGQAVAQLETRAAEIQLAQAQANLAAARAKAGDVQTASRPQQIAQAVNQVKALQATLSGAEKNLERAQQQRKKTEELLAIGGATPDQLDGVKTTEAASQAVVNSLKAQIRGAQEQENLLQAGATSYTLSASSAQVELAATQVELAKLQVDKARLLAPVDARVEQLILNPGELANPGAGVIKLIDDEKLQVTVYIPQSQLSQVKVGQMVKVKTESGTAETMGDIVFISSQGEFTPKNIQTQEQRATQVFAVKVALSGTTAGKFKPGQAVEVRLD